MLKMFHKKKSSLINIHLIYYFMQFNVLKIFKFYKNKKKFSIINKLILIAINFKNIYLKF